MYQSCLEKLEYKQVIEKISLYCKTYIGKENVLNIIPSFCVEEVKHNLASTTEAVNLIVHKSGIPICEISNCSIYLKQLESNVPLSMKGLLSVAHTLKVARETKEYFYSDTDFDFSSFPVLSDLFSLLYSNKRIEENIFQIIIDEHTIADEASPKLSSLRRQSKKLESNIKEKLNSFIHSSAYSKYIMEPIITIRNDRYVIPVKEEFRNQIKGLIHDMSASGSTVFIEPISVFEMNNEINEIRIAEKLEIEKILENLSNLLHSIFSEIKINIQTIGTLDALFAKAGYSIDINGTNPIINTEKFIELKDARHPLISKEIVVPINISIGKNYSSLVITGPNTGGKTVSLKTTGLLLLMAYSGIYIPCKENSSIYVFDSIFADIGDEQSIQESLSTFSSHMSNIIKIINLATPNSFILLDELGSGTDPVEGANLAISILEHFYNLGTLVISTTHYSELKNYCILKDGFENASSEFDLENLKPTYKLLIGIPGKSNAFAISKKLGLNETILNRAHSLLNKNEIHIEDLLKSIYDDKLLIEKEKEEITKNLKQIETLRKSLENENTLAREKEFKQIEDAKLEAKNIILSAKEEANEIIKQLNSLHSDELGTANKLRNKLNEHLKEVNISSNTYNNSNVSNNEINSNVLEKADIQIKMSVEVLPFHKIGTVLTHPNKSNEVQVQMENTKINVKISNLRKINNNCGAQKNLSKPSSLSTKNSFSNNASSSTSFKANNDFKAKYVSSEIKVIGLNVDEAVFMIDKYLDDCSIANLSPIRIVHGKGTGKLRQGIHNFLKTHPHVASFRLGTFGEGEMGVTVVEIK